VENLNNGRSVVVRINDRGPFTGGRIIDVSKAAAVSLGMIDAGEAMVRLRSLQTVPDAHSVTETAKEAAIAIELKYGLRS
jgi:rare lipoprotein A